MANVVIVGGAGYVGTRLHDLLPEAESVDPGILQGLCDRRGDVRNVSPHGDVVVWLASIHELREGDLEEDWRAVAEMLMVDGPLEWALEVVSRGGRFVYLSSTRAETAPERLYGRMKLRAERLLLEVGGDISIVRAGTVWGGLLPGRPNRVQTIINRLILEPGLEIFPGQESFYTTHLPRLVGELERSAHTRWRGLKTVTDSPEPINGALLRAGRRPRLFDLEKDLTNVEMVLAENTRHPMGLYAEYYNVGHCTEA